MAEAFYYHPFMPVVRLVQFHVLVGSKRSLWSHEEPSFARYVKRWQSHPLGVNEIRVVPSAVHYEAGIADLSEVRECSHWKPCLILSVHPVMHCVAHVFVPECVAKYA